MREVGLIVGAGPACSGKAALGKRGLIPIVELVAAEEVSVAVAAGNRRRCRVGTYPPTGQQLGVSQVGPSSKDPLSCGNLSMPTG